MATRKLEITETELLLGTVRYYAGDIKSFPKEEADEYIRLGWAKCVDTGEQGERTPGSAPINIDNVTQTIG